MVLAATFAACSGDSTDTPANGYNDAPTNPSGEAGEIRVNADVFQMMDGTRATTFDNDDAIQTEGSFFCKAYDAGTTTINTTSNVNSYVDWTVSTSSWAFADGSHNWPESGDLDFFAYMPASPGAYITGPTYTTAREPQFTCDMSETVDKEFIWALAIDQNKVDNISGVDLAFRHPFAKIIFKLSASHPDITINTITFKSLKTTGTCTFNGSTSNWTSLADVDNFVATINTDYNSNPSSPRQVGEAYLVIPQNFAGEIEVVATWAEWDEQIEHTLNTTLTPHTWQPGYSYTYIFTITETDLLVDTSKYTEQW